MAQGPGQACHVNELEEEEEQQQRGRARRGGKPLGRWREVQHGCFVVLWWKTACMDALFQLEHVI